MTAEIGQFVHSNSQTKIFATFGNSVHNCGHFQFQVAMSFFVNGQLCTVMDKSCFYKFVSKITNKLVKQLWSMTVYLPSKSAMWPYLTF